MPWILGNNNEDVPTEVIKSVFFSFWFLLIPFRVEAKSVHQYQSWLDKGSLCEHKERRVYLFWFIFRDGRTWRSQDLIKPKTREHVRTAQFHQSVGKDMRARVKGRREKMVAENVVARKEHKSHAPESVTWLRTERRWKKHTIQNVETKRCKGSIGELLWILLMNFNFSVPFPHELAALVVNQGDVTKWAMQISSRATHLECERRECILRESSMWLRMRWLHVKGTRLD